MKLADREDTVDVLGSEEAKDIDFSIDASKMGRFWRMMYEYSNPIPSFVRELTSNAVDAHIEARAYRDLTEDELFANGYGKEQDEDGSNPEKRKAYLTGMKMIFKDWEDKPVTVEMEKASLMDDSPDMIRFIDYGMGISPDRAENVYTKFGTSTKSSIEEQIGAFGLGAKSPVGYVDMFIVKTTWVGVEYTYAIHRTTQAPKMKLLDTQPTDRKNGTIVEIALQEGDYDKAQRAVREQLAYFDGVEFVNAGAAAGAVWEGENFLFRENTPFSTIHMCLGKVYYPLDLNALGVMGDEYFVPPPIALRVSLSDMTGPDPVDGHVSIVWNRENVQYNGATIAYLTEKYHAAIAELQTRYDDEKEKVEDFGTWFRLKQNEKVSQIELFDGVFLPNTAGVIKTIVTFPKYEALRRLPENPFTGWEVKKRVDDGKIQKLKALPTPIAVIKGEGLVGDILWIDKNGYSPQKNRYLDYEGHSRFYLIGRVKDVTVWDVYNMFGYYQGNPPTEEQVLLMDAFMAEVDQWVEDNYELYDDVVPSKAFKDSEKVKKEAKRSERIKLERGDDEFPARFLEVNEQTNYQGYEIRTFKWSMGTYSEWKAENLTAFTIYGSQEDEDLLTSMAHAVFSNRTFRQGDPDQNGRCFYYRDGLNPRRANIIKVARANQAYFESNPNAMHVKEFVTRRNKVLVRYVTAYQLMRRLPAGVGTLADPVMEKVDPAIQKAASFLVSYVQTYYGESQSHQMDEALLDQFQEMEKARLARDKRNAKLWEKICEKIPESNSASRHMAYRKNKLPTELPFLDYYAVDQFKEVLAFIQKYPLVLAIDLTTANVLDVKEYLRVMGRRGA